MHFSSPLPPKDDVRGKKLQLFVLLPWLVTVLEATVDDEADDGNGELLVQSEQVLLPSFSSLRASHLQVNLSLQ